MDKKGLTSAGKYFYEQSGLPPPGNFDYQQDAFRKNGGRSQYIKLMDGSTRKVSTWDPNQREWKHTALGKQFFSKAVDRYTIIWPCFTQLTRTNGSIYEREDWLPSTATELGEIEVPRALTEQAQRQKVAAIEAAWRSQQPMIGDRRALVVGYESATIDTSRQIQYNKLSMGSAGNTEAVMHRPLREGRPWCFHGLEGVSEDAYEQTENRCVSYQLSKHLKFKGGVAPWSQEKVAELLWNVTEALYEGDEDNPPEQGIGYSAAAITQLCKDLSIAVHIKWNGSKIESFVPERSQYEAIALYIWGDHVFTVGDPETTKRIAREKNSTPATQSGEVLATIGRRANSTPSCSFWDLFVKLAPGHHYTYDITGVRAGLLREGICPEVQLSGSGQMKALRYNDCHVHAMPPEAHICLKFLEELSRVRSHCLQYRGESLAMFCQSLFDEFSKPVDRPFLTNDIKKELLGKQRGKCGICGDSLDGGGEVDHTIPRGGKCWGGDQVAGLKYLCAMCHASKTSEDRCRMNVEDPNVWMSRFSQETWQGFVESRRPQQVVCNLQEAEVGKVCHEIDVRSCRLNGIIEGNVELIPIYSPLDEFVKAKEGVLYDYQWVDIGCVRSPLKSYIYDGPRWYDKATVKFMLENSVCKFCFFKFRSN